MRYCVAHIQTSFNEPWQNDLFCQALFDCGFDTIDGDDYYIPADVWEKNRDKIETLCATTEGAQLLGIHECPDNNWNATWEAEHPVQELPLGVKIVPHCAFGAGHHETTAMMIDALINHQPYFANRQIVNILDHGTGTGVLAIFAKHLGAEHVLAIDIDDKSVENAKENAALNEVEIDVRLGGDLSSFNFQPSTFNLILANIHRNVLLANMPSYAVMLAQGGLLWLSGFYEADCPTLIAAAEAYSLCHIATHSNGDWRMLMFAK